MSGLFWARVRACRLLGRSGVFCAPCRGFAQAQGLAQKQMPLPTETNVNGFRNRSRRPRPAGTAIASAAFTGAHETAIHTTHAADGSRHSAADSRPPNEVLLSVLGNGSGQHGKQRQHSDKIVKKAAAASQLGHNANVRAEDVYAEQRGEQMVALLEMGLEMDGALTAAAGSRKSRQVRKDFGQVFGRLVVKPFDAQLAELMQIEKVQYNRYPRLIRRMLRYRYKGQTRSIDKWLKKHVIQNNDFPESFDGEGNTVALYNLLIDHYASTGQDRYVSSILRRMRFLGLEPTTQTFNLLAKNYIRRSKNGRQLEQLYVMETIMSAMARRGLVPSIVTYYLVLCILPAGSASRERLKQMLVKRGLNHFPQFHDIVLTDMVNAGASVDDLLKYYRSVPLAELDGNCLNSVMFKMLCDIDDYERIWQWVVGEAERNSHTKKAALPVRSTLTILIKGCISRCNGSDSQLELMVRTLNSMAYDYKIVNPTSHYIILKYLALLAPEHIKPWFPLFAKYILLRETRFGTTNSNAVNFLGTLLQHKVDSLDFSDQDQQLLVPAGLVSTSLNEVTDFEDAFFWEMTVQVMVGQRKFASDDEFVRSIVSRALERLQRQEQGDFERSEMENTMREHVIEHRANQRQAEFQKRSVEHQRLLNERLLERQQARVVDEAAAITAPPEPANTPGTPDTPDTPVNFQA